MGKPNKQMEGVQATEGKPTGQDAQSQVSGKQEQTPEVGQIQPEKFYLLEPNNPESRITGSQLITLINQGQLAKKFQSLYDQTKQELDREKNMRTQYESELQKIKEEERLNSLLDKRLPRRQQATSANQNTQQGFEDIFNFGDEDRQEQQQQQQPQNFDMGEIVRVIVDEVSKPVQEQLDQLRQITQQAMQDRSEQQKQAQLREIVQGGFENDEIQLKAELPDIPDQAVRDILTLKRQAASSLAQAQRLAESDDQEDLIAARNHFSQYQQLDREATNKLAESRIQQNKAQQQKEYQQMLETGSFEGAPNIQEEELDKMELNPKKAEEKKKKRLDWAHSWLDKKNQALNSAGRG